MMKQLLVVVLLFIQVLLADDLDELLNTYEQNSDKSLETINEKLGIVINYSQKELRLMQYQTLNDVLKELPLLNLNTNTFGLSEPSLTGTKTTVSGFFRFFINNHEINSIYSQSPSLTWGDMPLDFVDHIEIYYGDSSFSVGSDTGIYFVRIYTKQASKENGGEIELHTQSDKNHSESITYAKTLKNDWEYLTFFNHSKTDDNKEINSVSLSNKSKRRYAYAQMNNDRTSINLAYTDTKKDNFMGQAMDATPNQGEITSRYFFADVKRSFLWDNSLNAKFSVDINNTTYSESNDEGIKIIPVLNLGNIPSTLPKQYYEDMTLTKIHTNISKKYTYEKHNFLFAFDFINKKYQLNDRNMTNMLNARSKLSEFNNFNVERTYSISLQEDYKLNEHTLLLANAKVNQYERNGFVKDTTDELFRVGAIYTPYKNFGIKSFYTQTYLAPSFYNIDYADKSKPELEAQKYRFFTFTSVFTSENSKSSLTYNHVKIDNFLFYSPVGFINIDHTITTQGLTFDFEYDLNLHNSLHFNYYTTTLSETINNSTKGGYLKFKGEWDNIGYFSSLIYKNGYSYLDTHVKASYDLDMGASYSFTKDFSVEIKGKNLLNKSSKSLYSHGLPEKTFSLDNQDKRLIQLTLKWVF